MKKNIKYTIFILSLTTISYGQHIDESFFFLSTDYSSNTKAFGITQSSINQPNIITTVSFASKQNYDLGYSNILTFNSDTSYTKPTAENDLFIGYTFYLTDKWSLYPNFTHMFHSKDAQTLIAPFTDAFQTDIIYFSENYNGSLNLGYYFSNDNMFYASLQNALCFTKEDFLIKNSLLDIQVGFYLNFSDINYYNESIYDNFDQFEFVSWIVENTGYQEISIHRIIQKFGLAGSKDYFKNIINNLTPETFEPAYKLSSLDLYLPINYAVGNFMLNFEPILSIPLADTKLYDFENTFMINAGISYAFFISGKTNL